MLSCILGCLCSTSGLALLTLLGILYYYFESNRLSELRQRYDILRERRQKEVKQAFERLSDQLKDDKDGSEITKQSLPEIKEKLDKGELKASDVLKAFQARALKLHEKFNCLVEPISEAQDEAQTFDEKKKTGLLAGIPISIKDDVGIKDYNTTAGLSSLLGEISMEDSVLVKVLRKNGAVIFARTNIPQAEMSVESSNPIYGTTRNPHHPNRSPGGSSSGEGSLIGGGGSLLGFGSDIGGSIRVPSHLCGICGLKPTSSRISTAGMTKFMEEPAIKGTWGPLARDVDSLVLAMRALWDGSMSEFDPLIPPVKFQNELFEEKRPLKIGYFYDNNVFSPTPVVRRALDMAIEELKKQGHQVFEWTPPDIEKCDVLQTEVMFADAGDGIMKIMEGDEVDDSMKLLTSVFRVPKFLRPILPFLAKTFISKRHGEAAQALLGTGSVYKYYLLQSKIKEFQAKVTEEWQKEGLDALICPPSPFPALVVGHPEHSISGGGYMFLYNLLDFPAGVVRMTKQTAKDIDDLKDYKTDKDFKLQDEIVEMVKDGEGLPVGVMVASLRWQDEKCLRVMKAVEKAADFVVQ